MYDIVYLHRTIADAMSSANKKHIYDISSLINGTVSFFIHKMARIHTHTRILWYKHTIKRGIENEKSMKRHQSFNYIN